LTSKKNEKKNLLRGSNINIIDSDTNTGLNNLLARRVSSRCSKWKISRPLPNLRRASELTDKKMKNSKRKKRIYHPTFVSKEITSPPYVFNTIGANPSMVKSVGDEITSPMKVMAMAGGKKGDMNYEHDHNSGRLDKLENSMLRLANNQETLCGRVNVLAKFATKVMHSTASTLYFL
jgi:hypothetical protein